MDDTTRNEDRTMRASNDVVHGAGADGSPGSADDPRAGRIPVPVSSRPSLSTMLQNQLLSATVCREPRLLLLFARAQQHAGQPHAERVYTAMCLKQQAQALVSWFVDASRQDGAARLALVFHTIDRLILLGEHLTDDAAAPGRDVPW